MTKCHFRVQEVEFLGRTITTKGVAPQKQKITKFFKKFKLSRSKKALQRYIGFLIFYRNYIPSLAERLTPFFQLLTTTDAKAKILITPDIMKEYRQINEALGRCRQLALRQPLPCKQLVLMTDASFQAAGYSGPKHAQTIGILERPHATIKTSLKMTSGDYRKQWQKYLPIAILNYNTTYHSSIDCEPSRIFQGRVPHKILDHKLGL